MIEAYPVQPGRLKDLYGFGPRSEETLAEVNITSVEDFMTIDPYDLYLLIKPMKGMGLDDLGVAPK